MNFCPSTNPLFLVVNTGMLCTTDGTNTGVIPFITLPDPLTESGYVCPGTETFNTGTYGICDVDWIQIDPAAPLVDDTKHSIDTLVTLVLVVVVLFAFIKGFQIGGTR